MDNVIIQKNGYSKVWAFVQNNLNLFLSILLLLIVLVIYSPVFSNLFLIGWDDQGIVINGYTGSGLRADNLWAILTQFYLFQYAPVNQFSYTLLYSIFGYDPFWFHTFCVFIHVANVLLTFGFIKRLLTESKVFDIRSINRIAFITALLMAVHPFLVESVAWISASKVLLYSFFYLLAIHFYFKYLKSKNIKYYMVVITMFFLSFGAKEQAVTLPICLLLIDYVLKRDLRNKKVWLEKLPFFILSLAFGCITLLSQNVEGGGLITQRPHYPLYQNIIFAGYAVTEYWIKCLIPVKLSHVYLFPNAIGQPVPIRFWIYPILIIIVVISFMDFWKKRWVFFGIMFFIVHLGLALNIIPMARHAIIADRYIYLASVGFFFLIAYILNQLVVSGFKYRSLTLSISLVYVMAISFYAHQYSKEWHDADKLKVNFKEALDRYLKENYKK